MQITLPWPDSRLLPNQRLHWAEKGRATQEARLAARFISEDWRNMQARCVGPLPRPLFASCTALVTFYPPDRRRRDLDNLLRACKPFWDGMVDGWILRDDSCIREISVRMASPDKVNPRVEITVEPCNRLVVGEKLEAKG